MQKFDVAVIGAGIAGLSIAALVSKSGKTVVLTDPADRAGGAAMAFEKDGFLFSAGPNIIYGLEQGGALNSVCAKMGVTGVELLRPARYQVVLPDRRITIALLQQDTLDELRREYPREIDSIAALYRDAGKIARKCASSRISTCLADRRSAGPFLRRYRFPPELIAFFAVQSYYFFGQGLESLPLSPFVMMLCTPPAEFPGGYTRLASQFATRITEQHGTILWNEPWPELHYRGRKASGITTTRGMMEARTAIINADHGSSEQTLFLGVHEEVLPVRMENTVLCLSDNRKPEEYFALEAAPRGSNAPANMRAFTVSFSAPSIAPAERESLLERIQSVMPFLKDFIVFDEIRYGSARRYPLPDDISPRFIDPRSAPHAAQRRTLKNVLMVPDSSRDLHLSARNAHLVASRLT